VFGSSFSRLYIAYSLVPEGLELSGPVAVSSGDTEEDTIVLLKGLGVGEDHVVGLGRCVHLGEDLVVKGLLDLVDVDFTTSLSDTSGLLLDHLQDVAVHRVLSQLLAHRVHDTRPKLRARKKQMTMMAKCSGTYENDSDFGSHFDDVYSRCYA
jgi:hypothetical protein